ncbi:MAG: T9SS type A sorting domain-containing protein, partial [Bacteroidota bacterium]
TIHTDSTRFDHLDFENASIAAFDFGDGNFGVTFNGNSSTYKMHCMTFSDIKVFNSSSFIITGYSSPTNTKNNLCDSIDMHNITIQDLQGAGQQVRGNMTHFEMSYWNITYSGHNTNVGDQGILYLSGNGSIHHNYMHGGRGYLARINAYSMKPFQDSVLFYNNIILSTTHYGGLDIRCDSTANGVSWNSATFINPIKNVYVLNNTIGNKGNELSFVVPVVVQYQMQNNNLLFCKNNLSFAADPNVTGLPNAGILVNYNGGSGKVDSSNNKYYSATAILSYLQDTLLTCRPTSTSALNGAGISNNLITTDFYNKIRPTPPSIGAVEYAGISSTVVANAGVNQTVTLPLDSVNLTGAASIAINSTISSYQWTQISGPSIAKFGTPNLVNSIASTLKSGVYVFSIKVKNNYNDSSSSSVTITVNPQNFPPIVSAGSNQTITLPTSTVILTGTATDATGTIASYLWSQVSGPNTATIISKSAISTSVNGLVAGSYVFQLQATDNLGLSGNGSVTITVNPQNLPPVANAGTDQIITVPVSSVSVDGSLSIDPDGSIAIFGWSQISGPSTSTITNPNKAKTSISGLVPGIYVFKLTVTDNLGLSASTQITITVNVATAISQIPNENPSQVLIFPNPVISYLNLQVSNNSIGKMTISIVDVNGKILYNESVNKLVSTFVTPINVSTLPNGVYFLLGSFSKFPSINTRFIKQ